MTTIRVSGRRYVSIWKICSPEGQSFGDPLEVDIFVDSEATNTGTHSAPIVSFGISTEQQTQTNLSQESEKNQEESKKEKEETEENTSGFPYVSELKQLLDMGFGYEAVKNLLNKFNGSLLEVLNEVLRN
eukprot:TRINITY_DN304_c0_g1_i2.p1 TRINITY_DN304_c0_g1~~TRINITY_DN304_c0_g1_i2.p1  ORF type:complete len:130 (-),score=22.25 TRINITY_DN304_c0_g1_i2:124-513(-)